MTRRRCLWAFIAAIILVCVLLAPAARRVQRVVHAQTDPTPAVSHPTSTPRVTTSPAAMPTPDRLAPPPTAENPTQADEGAQIYWLYCQPCHGDRGQGLTDEWRAQYPEDHQNCWTSGCHGDRPYENGFTLPTEVPPVTGPDSLQNFEHMGLVLSYMSSAMPYNAPGSLEEEEYLAIAAYLAREHGIWDGAPLRQDNAAALRLRPAAPTTPATTAPEAAQSDDPQQSAAAATRSPAPWLLAIISLIIIALGGVLWRRRDRA